jgi:aminopeptidase YwaD
MKHLVFILILPVLFSCTQRLNPDIQADDFKEIIGYLASDSLQGRGTGTEGDQLATEFIRAKFKEAGLQLLYEDGYQLFEVITEATPGKNNALIINDKEYPMETGFRPYSFTANARFSGEVVFAGYGFDIDEETIRWNDYEGLDVAGKWVLVLKGDPEMEKTESLYVKYSDVRSKVLVACDRNAGGILLVGGPEYAVEDELEPLFYDKNSSRYSIPVIQVTRKVANEILHASGKDIATLEKKLNTTLGPVSFATKATVTAMADVVLNQVATRNVAALLRGNDPELAAEYVVVGAHHDHLGLGGPGSGSRMPDTVAVHNGADDNASGVAAVIELAHKAASEKKNRRSLLFVTFSAEEMGLVGSRAFTAEPPVDLDQVSAMFNFDMIGRLDSTTRTLSIGGTETASEIDSLLNQYNPDFELALSGEGTGPSDHASFYLKEIPVFFVSTGAHSDYHTPEDDASLINYAGASDITSYAYDLLTAVANADQMLTFREAGSLQRASRGNLKVTLGIMPDFAGIEKRGLRVDAVTKGKPAFKGGMKKGDIITAIDGKKVGNIYDYMNRLNVLEPDQIITVDILRDNKNLVLIIQL